jgi:DNA-binding beta-propeller fold protein YncE
MLGRIEPLVLLPGLMLVGIACGDPAGDVSNLPPTLQAQVPAGDYFDRDVITISYGVADDYGLERVYWELRPGLDGSTKISGLQTFTELRLTVQHDWAGPGRLKLWARDRFGLGSDVVLFPEGHITLPATIQRSASKATVNCWVQGVLTDEKRNRVYLMCPNDRRMYVMNGATTTITHSLSLPGLATDMDLTPGGDSLILTLPGHDALGVIDLRAADLSVQMLFLESFEGTTQGPWRVRTLSNGKAFVAANEFPDVTSPLMLVEVDLSRGADRIRPDAADPGMDEVRALARSHDYSRMVLSAGSGKMQTYDVAQNSFGPVINLSGRAIELDRTGAMLAVGVNVYDGRTLQYLRTVRSTHHGGGFATAMSPDGTHIYIAHAVHGIIRSRTSDGAIVDRSPNPIRFVELLRASPDGRFLVTVEPNLSVQQSHLSIMQFQ